MNITPAQPASLITTSDMRALDDAVRDFIGAELAGNSIRGYRADIRLFVQFCQEYGIELVRGAAVTPETAVRFLSYCANRGDKAATIVRRRAALRWSLQAAGLASPTTHPLVAKTMRGIMRKVGRSQDKKAPVLDRNLLDMLDKTDRQTLTGLRDYALMVVAFSGALRRSELVAITVENLRFVSAGVELTIPKSKTDQEGAGQTIALLEGRRIRPAEALRDWIAAAGITSGPVFLAMKSNGTPREKAMTDHAAASIIKRYAALSGMNPQQISGHSMRAGFVTSAILGGANIMKVMDVSRHTKVDTLRGYVRIAEQFKDHAGSGWM